MVSERCKPQQPVQSNYSSRNLRNTVLGKITRKVNLKHKIWVAWEGRCHFDLGRRPRLNPILMSCWKLRWDMFRAAACLGITHKSTHAIVFNSKSLMSCLSVTCGVLLWGWTQASRGGFYVNDSKDTGKPGWIVENWNIGFIFELMGNKSQWWYISFALCCVLLWLNSRQCQPYFYGICHW